jgi:hypothetical protein
MKMPLGSEQVYTCDGGNIYHLKGLYYFFQQDQNRVSQDVNEAAEIQVW